MSTAVKNDTFEQEVLQSDVPVLVDFWAEWCGPCHAVAPVLDRIVEEQAGGLKLVKVNIDEERELAERFGIASIPTMILFRDGEPSVSVIGAQPKGAIERTPGPLPDQRFNFSLLRRAAIRRSSSSGPLLRRRSR
jgi:thioredoxin